MLKFLKKGEVNILNLAYVSDILGIIGFLLTVITLLTTLNVRSQVIHSHERQHFKANSEQIYGNIDGFIRSLSMDNLDTKRFYQQIDVFMVDLLSRYTFLNFRIKLKCKSVSQDTKSSKDKQAMNMKLTKHLTELKNMISKEANL